MKPFVQKRLALVLGALIAAVAIAGCGSESSGDAVGSGSAAGSPEHASRSQGGASEGVSVDPATGAEESSGDDAVTEGFASGPVTGKSAGIKASTKYEISDKNMDIGPGFTHASDPNDDAQIVGAPPAYGEMVAASLDDDGEQITLTLTFADQVPQVMLQDDYMAIAWNLLPGGKNTRDEGWTYGAYASPKGWDAFKAAEPQPTPLPGRVIVRGSDVIFTVPWSEIGGPQVLRWKAQSTWLRRDGGEATDYAIDGAPNGDFLGPFRAL